MRMPKGVKRHMYSSKSKYRRRNVAKDLKEIKAYEAWQVSPWSSYTRSKRHTGTKKVTRYIQPSHVPI